MRMVTLPFSTAATNRTRKIHAHLEAWRRVTAVIAVYVHEKRLSLELLIELLNNLWQRALGVDQQTHGVVGLGHAERIEVRIELAIGRHGLGFREYRRDLEDKVVCDLIERIRIVLEVGRIQLHVYKRSEIAPVGSHRLTGKLRTSHRLCRGRKPYLFFDRLDRHRRNGTEAELTFVAEIDTHEAWELQCSDLLAHLLKESFASQGGNQVGQRKVDVAFYS